MDEKENIVKDDFVGNLKAKAYCEELKFVSSEAPALLRFKIMYIHDIFRSERFKGSKLLEIGSGATVHSIAAASAYFPNITMSDFVPDNVENLKKWLKGESNLKQLLEVQAGLEGYGNDLETGIKLIESRIRKTVKRVTRCDVLTSNVLLDESSDPETSPPFDMVVSCLCLEVAPKDFDGYVRVLRRVNRLLNPGGGLLICGFFNGSKWKVGEQEFHHIQLGEIELMDALSKAGFDNIYIKTMESDKSKQINSFSYDKMFCVNATKMY